MPRPSAKFKLRKGKGIPEGVSNSIAALAVQGETPFPDIARDYGVDITVVKRIASTVRGIDPAEVITLRAALPSLMTILATAHALEALRRAESDPTTAAKSTFAAKLAVEAGRISLPAADRPGVQILAYVNTLNAPPPLEGASQGFLIPEGVVEAELSTPPTDILPLRTTSSQPQPAGDGPLPEGPPLTLTDGAA